MDTLLRHWHMLRRFTFKCCFDYLRGEQSEQAFAHFFGFRPDGVPASAVIGLTPDDFAVVRRKAEALGLLDDGSELCRLLREEMRPGDEVPGWRGWWGSVQNEMAACLDGEETMGTRWSKLQKETYLLRAEGLDFQIHCRVYRMKSQRGSSGLPRYWITLDGETIWDYPKDFAKTTTSLESLANYPHETDVSAISELIREYIDTPKDLLRTKQFENDRWGLADILKAADRRNGLKRLTELGEMSGALAVRKIVAARLRGR